MTYLKDYFSFNKKLLLALIIFIITGISLSKTITRYHNEKLIKSNPVYTVGEVTDYGEIGIANYYLKYNYYVDGGVYSNEVSERFVVNQTKDSSFNRKIYVEYCKDNPSISIPILDSIPKN
jgi:uncharacterized protein YneF (UPF0154 family)